MIFDRDYPTLTANMSELRPNKEVMSRFSTTSKRLAKVSPMPPRCPGNRNATHNWMLAERPALPMFCLLRFFWGVSRERRASLHTAVGVSGATVPPKSPKL